MFEQSRNSSKIKNVLIFAPSFPPAYLSGGPAQTLFALSQKEVNRELLIVTSAFDLGRVPLKVPKNKWMRNGNKVVYFVGGRFSHYLSFLHSLIKIQPDLIYCNSLFNFKFSILPMILGQLGFWKNSKFLMAPRGELFTAALNSKSWKKNIALWCFKRSGQYQKLIWQASNQLEADEIINVFGNQVSFIVHQDETSLDKYEMKPTSSKSGFLRVIYVGRITPHKGLDIALKALLNVRSPCIFDIFGPIENIDFYDDCLKIASFAPHNIHIRFKGPIDHDNVIETFNSHDVLVFPTKSENFGHVIAESLSASCLVLAPDTTSWSTIIEKGGGKLIAERENVPLWSESIEYFAAMSEKRLYSAKTKAGVVYRNWYEAQSKQNLFDVIEETKIT